MASNAELLAKVLDDTAACQDPHSQESASRSTSSYGPFGPHISGESGGYPTTDVAMAAIADLADRVLDNDATLKLSIGRDAMRLLASHVIGERLQDFGREPDRAKHWPMMREALLSRARSAGKDIAHYIPVWLFLDQDCGAFSIGAVRFIQRSDWPAAISERRGQESDWLPGLKTLWAGGRIQAGDWRAGVKRALAAVRARPLSPTDWFRQYSEGVRASEPKSTFNARRVARLVHPDQWIASANVIGFEADESRRRGLLAARVALDTVRLVLPGSHRRLLSTAADSTVPRFVDRLSQGAKQDLSLGWHFNRPGIGGPPNFAQHVVTQSAPIFLAAGECISAMTTTAPTHPCPQLAERWFNATHWFGRACLADADFVAVVMLVIALDVLSGGLEQHGIFELVARLTGMSVSKPVLSDGTNLKKLVNRTYKLRSEVAHGSILAVNVLLDEERGQLEELTAVALQSYALTLETYAGKAGLDDRDAFRNSLPPIQP